MNIRQLLIWGVIALAVLAVLSFGFGLTFGAILGGNEMLLVDLGLGAIGLLILVGMIRLPGMLRWLAGIGLLALAFILYYYRGAL